MSDGSDASGSAAPAGDMAPAASAELARRADALRQLVRIKVADDNGLLLLDPTFSSVSTAVVAVLRCDVVCNRKCMQWTNRTEQQQVFITPRKTYVKQQLFQIDRDVLQ